MDAGNDPFGLEGELPEPLPESPSGLLAAWYEDAQRRAGTPNPNAFTLATADVSGAPSARIVLCKHMDAQRGMLVFYTNYQGRKGRELESNPRAAAVFHWDGLDRQARLEGRIVRSPAEESDAYFASRPVQSRLGAWASRQSQPLASRQALLDQVGEAIIELGLDAGVLMDASGDAKIPRPPFWGGYRLWATRIELWVGATGRIHDRAAWTRDLAPRGAFEFDAGPWSATRLNP